MKRLRIFAFFMTLLFVVGFTGLLVAEYQSSGVRTREYVHEHRVYAKGGGERKPYYLTDSQENWRATFIWLAWPPFAALVLMGVWVQFKRTKS